MMRGRYYWVSFLGLLLVYALGLPNTLMENDSAQFAVMAQRMVQEGDFINLIKGTEEYLDKPHMHYWLAAGSYLIFGVSDWAYRIPALLITLLGAYSCYGLGRLYYGENTGRLASLIFMSAQTIVLSVIDVRTDAVLTGFAAFALWQLLCYLERGGTAGLLLGALGAGLAFSTKGQIALVVIGLPLLVQLVYTGRWKRLLDARVLLALLVFTLAISPVLYAYYQQFDLHPEKVIRGRSHRSGLLFILWEQSFERMSGSGMGKNSSDYFFFFHTFLWVFLPWTVLGLAAFGKGASTLWKGLRGHLPRPPEAWTVGGSAAIFVLISFAQFKLPHYLNITIPLFAVLTASYIVRLESAKRLKVFTGVQAGIFGLVWIAVAGIVLWVFALPPWLSGLIVFAGLFVAIGIWRKAPGPHMRLTGLALWAAIFLNAVMNGHFYPQLLNYQAGSEMAFQLKRERPEVDVIHKVGEGHTWAMDFYTGRPLAVTRINRLRADGVRWLYADGKQLEKLRESGIAMDTLLHAKQFRITRLQPRFLNPKTREAVLRDRYLVRILP